MIYGIGIDIIEISRIEKAIKRYNKKILCRVFTPEEIKYCQGKPLPWQHYAARFAVKEALIKAFGKPLTLNEIGIEKHTGKAPKLKLYRNVKKKLHKKKALLSISHDHEYAIAQVILTK